MSDFWSTWVIVFICISLGLTVFLFLWGPRVDIPTEQDGTSGHVWAHGVLREAIRDLPLWWIVLSAICLAAALVYLALYPGFGGYKGYLDWTSHGELTAEQAANLKLITPLRERVHGKSVEAIAGDPAAVRAGAILFSENCTACHGREARGNIVIGAPDLTDSGDFLYGGDGKSILTSILDGRTGAMPAFASSLSSDEISDLAHYVASLSGRSHDSLRGALGKRLFSNCVPCHGADGKGNQAMGAPNLTDAIWLYGGDADTIRATIKDGRAGVMPHWDGRLDSVTIKMLAAYVHSLGGGEDDLPAAKTAQR